MDAGRGRRSRPRRRSLFRLARHPRSGLARGPWALTARRLACSQTLNPQHCEKTTRTVRMIEFMNGLGVNLQPQFWASVVEIIWINILLSGDNAIVIALACRNLAPKQRMLGMV